jgi:hypothetical protein
MFLWLREIPSYEKVSRWKSTVADYHASELRKGRSPKSDTSTREVLSSERREYLGCSQRLHAKSSDQKGGPTRIAISAIGSLRKGTKGLRLASREMKRPKGKPTLSGVISALHLKRTPGARFSPPPFRPSWFQRAKRSSLMSRYEK